MKLSDIVKYISDARIAGTKINGLYINHADARSIEEDLLDTAMSTPVVELLVPLPRDARMRILDVPVWAADHVPLGQIECWEVRG